MTLSGPFITRPIATSLLMFAILLAGLLAYRLLPISSLPEVDYPTMQVVTFYPGASPAVMTTSVTAPLERQFGQMPGLEKMTSTSSMGASVITLQFSLEMTLDVAEQQVQAAINAATNFLPTGLPVPPIYSKVNPADTPIMTLALTSTSQPLYKVADYAETRLVQRLSQLSGIGLVSVGGGQRPAVRVQVNPTTLAAYGLTLENIRSVIGSANINAAKGNFDGPRLAYTINTNDQLLSAAEYKPLIVAYKNNAPVRLSDVANVIDGPENKMIAAWMNTQPAIIINIQRQPGANVIAVDDHIQALLPQLKEVLPGDMQLHVVSDRTVTIRASINDVQHELIIAILLVVMVIYAFLRSLAGTIIPAIAVPLSLIGTLAVMYLFGYSLNNLTLMALTIATGFVVDDAIVMIENISRYIENGEPPFTAAIKGAQQIAFTILSLSVSLIAVLIPLLFMSDLVGRLFREFAMTLATTIIISAFVSLTLTPMMCARILRRNEHINENKYLQRIGNFIDTMIERYGSSLRWVLARQPLTLFIFYATTLITIILLYLIPKGFFPLQDNGLIQGISQAPQSISFAAMQQRQKSLAELVLANPNVANVSSFIGIDGVNSTLNSGRLLISLKPYGERDLSAYQVINQIQDKVKNNGISLFMQPVQDLTIDTRVSRNQYQLSMSSPDADKVTQWSEALIAKLKQSKLFSGVTSDLQNVGLETHLAIDRDTASRFGITPQMIDDTLYDAFGQRQVSIIFTQRNQYRVVLEVLPSMSGDPSGLNNIYINTALANGTSAATANPVTANARTSNATGLINGLFTTTNLNSNVAIPLLSLVNLTHAMGPLVINRQGQFPVATISFNLAPNASLGSAITAINQATKELKIPESVQTDFEGSAKIFINSLNNEGWLVLAAIIVVYLTLGILYESFIHPLTIISTLPSAGMGALLALMITRHELSVIAVIGIILLIGIVMKNAIMMIDFALEQERKYQQSPEDAIYKAACLRFRPILMTTLAALFAAVPLALGTGIGSELRHPLGIAIIGGLIVSQLLTLYTTPVIYLAFDRTARRLMSWRLKREV